MSETSSLDAQSVIRQITKAWDKLPVPNGYTEVGGYEDYGEFRYVFDLYGHKYWKPLVDADLRSGYGSIALMSTYEGKSYYLSAHMVRLIKEVAPSGNLELAYDLFDTIHRTLFAIDERSDFEKLFNFEQISALKGFVDLVPEILDDDGSLSDLRELISRHSHKKCPKKKRSSNRKGPRKVD